MKRSDGLNEVMVLKVGGDGQSYPKLFMVDDATIARLTLIRGNLFQDNPRLRAMADMPTMLAQIEEAVISPEMARRAEEAFQAYIASKAGTASPVTPSTATQPQTARPLTPEEEWRTRPDIRKEFASLASYAAYKRAAEAGRCKVYGQAT